MSQVTEVKSGSIIDIARVLNWSGKNIRVYGTPDQPWFCGTDVAKALGYTNTTDALGHVKSHQKCIGANIPMGSNSLPMNQYDKRALFTNEGGLYAMIMKSKKKEAEAFQDWVTDDVLPSIRRTGSYQLNTQLQTLQNELTTQRLLTDRSTQMVEEQKKLIEAEQKRIEDLRVQAEVDRIKAENEKKALQLAHETEQKQKDEQLALQREALRLKDDITAKWKEKAINTEAPLKENLMYLASTTQYMKDSCFKVGGVECEVALSARLNSYNSGHTESDPFYYIWKGRCHNFRAVESIFWTINEQYRDRIGTKKEMIRMQREDILRDLNRIMSHIDTIVNECVAEYPETMRRAIELEGPVYPNIDEVKAKKPPKINVAAAAELETAKKEIIKHIASRFPNYSFDTDKDSVAITIEWKSLAPNFDTYSNTRTHWCKLTKSILFGTKISFIPRAAPSP